MSTSEDMINEGSPTHSMEEPSSNPNEFFVSDPIPLEHPIVFEDSLKQSLRIVYLEEIIGILTDPDMGRFMTTTLVTVWEDPPYQKEMYQCIYCLNCTEIDVADDFVPDNEWHTDECPIKRGWHMIRDQK